MSLQEEYISFPNTARASLSTLFPSTTLFRSVELRREHRRAGLGLEQRVVEAPADPAAPERRDRKSTRLNSSHGYISYAVFCLKKKNTPGSTDSIAPRTPNYNSPPYTLNSTCI